MEDTEFVGKFRSVIRGKTRIGLAWLFAILLGFCSRRYPHWFGILVCFAGASLRFWASGFLRKDNKPAVGGPYAYLRNPLYFGTYLMAIGIVLSIIQNTAHVVFLVLFSVGYAAIYHFIIRDEEEKLSEIFGEPYTLYCDLVPRFSPRFWPLPVGALQKVNPDESQHRFDWELAMKNRAYEAYLACIGLIAYVALAAFLWTIL